MTVRQGDSGDVDFRYSDNRVLTAATCQLQVRDQWDGLKIDREIVTYNDNETRFIARLTPAETLSLPVGIYVLSGQISEPVSESALELVAELEIIKQYNY